MGSSSPLSMLLAIQSVAAMVYTVTLHLVVQALGVLIGGGGGVMQ